MKKLSFILLGLIIALSGMSQNYFETFVRSDDDILREGRLVVETTNHGYIISFNAKETLDNEMLASLSPSNLPTGIKPTLAPVRKRVNPTRVYPKPMRIRQNSFLFSFLVAIWNPIKNTNIGARDIDISLR